MSRIPPTVIADFLSQLRIVQCANERSRLRAGARILKLFAQVGDAGTAVLHAEARKAGLAYLLEIKPKGTP